MTNNTPAKEKRSIDPRASNPSPLFYIHFTFILVKAV